MQTLPANWTARTLEALAVPDNESTRVIMSAWRQSTPLPDYVFNPIGMPAGAKGAPAYLNTSYAIFRDMTVFLAAVASFASTYQGRRLPAEMTGEPPYPSAWRAIHALGWPGGQYESDYPAALLDLTSESYRASASATPASARKTTGMLLPRGATVMPSTEGSQAVSSATAALNGAVSMTQQKMRG
jgi:hypothetical protein